MLLVVTLFVGVVATGCSAENTIEKFGGKIELAWEDVKSEFKDLEKEAKKETEEVEEMSKEDFENLIDEVEDLYEEVNEKVTSENHEIAKEAYKKAHKLELLIKDKESKASKEVAELAKNTKIYLKHLYGEAEEDFSKVKRNVIKGFEKVEDFSEEEWKNITDSFKK